LTHQQRTRNFCIIAHIDHGKSTLADRLLEITGAIDEREMVEQVLDQMDLERERGITIKASAVRLDYVADDGETYHLNLIDTPGHVDFNYEVSRSLAACEGAVLVIDAAQSVEAQTVANAYLAVNAGLEVLPVVNKIDLANANPERALTELEDIVGISREGALLCSAKQGTGVREVLEAIVHRVPPPVADIEAPLRALVFDSAFDLYRGVVTYVRVIEGRLRAGGDVRFMTTGVMGEVHEVGVLRPAVTPTEELLAGDVGYIVAGVRDVTRVHVGDTITAKERPAQAALPGYREAKPMVFCGLYPEDGCDYTVLRESLERLRLNDPAFTFAAESSLALGFGFRCGFLGLLHMEIVQERLEREYGHPLIATAPSVVYRVERSDGQTVEIDNPSKMPLPHETESISEPFVEVTLICPAAYIGSCLELCEERRGEYGNLDCANSERVLILYRLPLSEIILDFFDQLKSRTRGYASMDYEPIGYRRADLVRLDIRLNGQPVDALSFITPRERSQARGKALALKLKEILPRQLVEIRIQAAIGNKVIASERITALSKNVTAKCYGGDITRKRKLWAKVKAGKRRMKQVASIDVPQEAFMSVLSVGE